jgi:hypothetical protein
VSRLHPGQGGHAGLGFDRVVLLLVHEVGTLTRVGFQPVKNGIDGNHLPSIEQPGAGNDESTDRSTGDGSTSSRPDP